MSFRSIVKTTFILALIFCSMGLYAQTNENVQKDEEVKTEQQAVPAVKTKSQLNSQKLEKVPLDAQDPETRSKNVSGTATEGALRSGHTQSKLQEEINNIRVITPEKYSQLKDEQKKAIDEDPLYFVTDKDRKQVMAEYGRKKLMTPED